MAANTSRERNLPGRGVLCGSVRGRQANKDRAELEVVHCILGHDQAAPRAICDSPTLASPQITEAMWRKSLRAASRSRVLLGQRQAPQPASDGIIGKLTLARPRAPA